MPFVAVSIVDQPRQVRQFADKFGLTAPIALAEDDVLTPLGVQGVPAVAILEGGRITALATTSVTAADLEGAIAAWR